MGFSPEVCFSFRSPETLSPLPSIQPALQLKPQHLIALGYTDPAVLKPGSLASSRLYKTLPSAPRVPRRAGRSRFYMSRQIGCIDWVLLATALLLRKHLDLAGVLAKDLVEA